MKLAEALQERADLNKVIQQLTDRIMSNTIIQEGEAPDEAPEELMKSLDEACERLEELIRRINLTNCETKTGEGTLTDLIAKKDVLRVRIESYRNIASMASQRNYRASGREIKMLTTVNVSDIRSRIDEMSKDLRDTENLIQETNWLTELK